MLACFAESFEPEAAEALEIAVKRAQDRAVFDCERGQMRVRGESAARPSGEKQSRENLRVPLRRMKHTSARLGDPGSHDGKRIFDGERFRENTVTSSKADKAKQRHPCETDAD